ncbi:unnamed protein product [Adineta steineri]|uniref:Uncharacterized protein n=1 Tax=Adineta steineri TaxID=433720 RepID=A0A813MH71_9BILA|nr:unnamed protein product [Adineta steineri]CAF4026676.1 unnamed protein product [Adineta steineri]
MSLLRNFIIFLIYINSLSYALQCTTDCYFQSNLSTTFEIPKSCNQIILAKNCGIRMSFSYSPYYSSLSFNLQHSNYSLGDFYSASVELSDGGSFDFYYSIDHTCNHKDDCAIEFANNNIRNILRRLDFNHADLIRELSPLLSTNVSIETSDVACFDSNERVRQCGIVTKPGLCQAAQQLTGRQKTNRTCNYESYRGEKSVSIYDFGSFASFSITCNRSLCNGPMTQQAIKEIMFKYNITKTIGGRLNNGLRLSLSSTFLLSIIVFLLYA